MSSSSLSLFCTSIVDAWSQYENPEEGKQREGDIYIRQTRKTITRNKLLLWPNGIVRYHVDSQIGELRYLPTLSQKHRNHDICDDKVIIPVR
jgi:hypothetical protein